MADRITSGQAPGMHWSRERAAGSGGDPAFPDLLAEYGRLAAELPEADANRTAHLRHRMRVLDEQIDEWARRVGTDRV